MGDVSVSRGPEQATLSSPRSLGQLFGEVSRELGALVKHEVELAKSQLREEADDADRVDTHLGIAVAAGAMSVLLISFAVVWGLAEIMPTGLAFLVVGAAYAGVAVFLVMRNRDVVQADTEPPPSGNGAIALDTPTDGDR
jgi:hypothetical protein